MFSAHTSLFLLYLKSESPVSSVYLIGIAVSSEYPILTVTQLTRLLRHLLQDAFPHIQVEGEISNCMRASSGHMYFSLKDGSAQIRCILWRSTSENQSIEPQNGNNVIVQGAITLYEARGDYQIQVKKISPAGSGKLHLLFEELKKKLSDEGLFEEKRKKPIPSYPMAIGIITSIQAAALRDILSVLKNQRPDAQIIIYPASVQGKKSAHEVERALTVANQRNEVEVLIVTRGGGSLEDLWPFNEEIAARAIADSHIPVVTGIGHETDFTIADFVSDHRAPTPTAAAHIMGHNPQQKKMLLQSYQRMKQFVTNFCKQKQQSLDRFQMRLQHPRTKLYKTRERMHALFYELEHRTHKKINGITKTYHVLFHRLTHCQPNAQAQRNSWNQSIERLLRSVFLCHEKYKNKHEKLAQSLEHLNPQAILTRGYSIVLDHDDHIVTKREQTHPKQDITIVFCDGHVSAKIHSS